MQTLSNKFKLRYIETIKLLQFHKLGRRSYENAEEWMGSLKMSAIECNYKEIERQLKEQFRHVLNDSHMSIEIIREFTKIEDNKSITSKQVLVWERRVETQKAQSAI